MRNKVVSFILLIGVLSVLTPGVVSASITIGDTVRVIVNLNVRTGSGTGYPEISDPDYSGYAPAGTTGTVIGGPVSANGYIWWQVDYGPGLYTGWSVETGLEKASLLPGPTLYSPDDNADDVSTTHYFDWSSVSGATNYWLMVAENENDLPDDPSAGSCSNCAISEMWLTSSSYSTPSSTSLSENTAYWWQVQPFEWDGSSVTRQGEYSQHYRFTTYPEHILPDHPAAFWNPADPSNYTVSARPDTYPIMYVIIHVAQGYYSGTINWFQYPGSNVSAHYVVKSSDGEITQMVRHKDIAWHAGNWNYNTWSIGIEHEGYINDPSWFTDQMYESSAALTGYICDLYGIPKTRTYIIGHNEVPGATHTDPGPYWDWDYYMQLVTGLAGDINGDGKVGLTDFAILASQWLQAPGVPSADIAPEGGDGLIDFLDLAALTEHWLEDTTP